MIFCFAKENESKLINWQNKKLSLYNLVYIKREALLFNIFTLH